MMLEPEESLKVSRSLYAQMCHFHEETEQHRIHSERATRKTAILVQSIGTLLLVFVIVIGVYMTQLTNQFIEIVDTIDQMNVRAEKISSYMDDMTENVARMNYDVSYMHEVLSNMRQINGHIDRMKQQVTTINTTFGRLNQLGLTAEETVHAMNEKMNRINQFTSQMNHRMYQISKPMKMMPEP